MLTPRTSDRTFSSQQSQAKPNKFKIRSGIKQLKMLITCSCRIRATCHSCLVYILIKTHRLWTR